MMAKPIDGAKIYHALKDNDTIVMACNARIPTGIATGILRAAKAVDAPVIFEIAKSESNLEGGYTGLLPDEFARRINEAAEAVGHEIYAIHADHLTLKKGDEVELEYTKNLIKSQIDAGFTSFAIDASFLFNTGADNVHEQLKKNIDVTTELAKFIEEHYGSQEFGLEVEVGEIGKTDGSGKVITSPEEATTYISSLNNNGINPHIIAIANGSTHGNIYDQNGNLIEQVSIDIPRTKAVAEALRNMGTPVRIAQHGITGTPLQLIHTQFPRGDIIKGNVGTYWMNIVWETVKIHQPELYGRIWGWTMDKYRDEARDKKNITKEEQIFGLYSKFAIKEFKNDLDNLDEDTVRAIDAYAYYVALNFFRAFNSKGKAALVRQLL
ncbi:fructose-bisphosphate aldolase [Candidatus Woesearchaeota archaeon CG11_big_fil_rev_8_21_14_0_20_43_8]|nr:MAG: fructose-bisphosphate aldolase [Candidatus Woesearchaeota archaeon CG11_big_fil_rev_8_21_14_0_20_43_8]PIO05520.1 MAG: fructose-bisphosphate aldolase [Candidatus Woesearchaeota archaeon CG08_land_8_20_14_0_20_43_7]